MRKDEPEGGEETEFDQDGEATHNVPTGSEEDIVALELPIDQGMVVLGRRGLGKSTLIRWLCGEVPYDLTVLDVAGDMEDLKKLGSPSDGISNLFSDLKLKDGKRHVDYFFVNPHDEKKVSEIILEAEKKGRRWVILDEADRYDYYSNVKNALSDFVNLGRHYQCGYIAGARRTANLGTDFIANATYAFIFRHTNRNDIAYLLKEFELTERQLRTLPDYHFIVCKNGVPLFIAKIDL